MRRGAIALAAVAAAACGASHRAARVPEGTGPLVGTYKAEFVRSGEPARRGRLLVWAEAPDRLHAELLSPVGGTPMTLDAGGGQAVLVDVSEKTAYVGDDGPAAIASLTGVPIGIADAVAALLHGKEVEGGRVVREGEIPGRLPSRFSLEVGDTRLGLTLLRWERASRDRTTLGTGRPPAGLAVRPLEAWNP